MKIISHRGGAKIAPENSIEAIKVSKSLGVNAAEIDIRITKDEQLVVFHDKNLLRLANIDKDITNLTVKEIKEIKLKNGQYIPTLEELINASDDLPLVIEGKGNGWGKILANKLRSYKNKNRFRVISFNVNELAIFSKLSLSVDCYYLRFINGFKAVTIASEYGFKGIDIHYLAFNPMVYKRAKEKNLSVIIFTPNLKLYSKYIHKYYPDVELTTDRPDKLLKLIKPIEK